MREERFSFFVNLLQKSKKYAIIKKTPNAAFSIYLRRNKK